MPDTGYFQHIRVTTVGGVRVMSCLRCGFSVGGLREDLLRTIVQQHRCRGEREPETADKAGTPAKS